MLLGILGFWQVIVFLMRALMAMAVAYLPGMADGSFDPEADLNLDGVIDNGDVDILSAMWADDGGGVRSRVYYYHFDGTGNVVGVSDSGGDCAEIYRYGPYGDFAIYAPDGSKQDESVCGNEYLFGGRRFDGETGLYYLRARMYNPAIGRFLQTDPIGYEDSMNLYQYCLNNPLMWTDPMGENVFGGMVSWISGNGWDNSYDMGWSEAGQLGLGAAEGGVKGGAAWVDGVVPVWNPLQEVYANADGSIDGVYTFSRAMGHVSRDAAIAAFSSPQNIGMYMKNPKLYEAGSVALRDFDYFIKYGLDGLNAVQKGAKLMNRVGSFWKIQRMASVAKGFQLLHTGLTPGAGILAIGVFEGADTMFDGAIPPLNLRK